MSCLLTAITFLPMIGVLILLFINREHEKPMKVVTFAVTLITFLVSLLLLPNFDLTTSSMQFVEKFPWIPTGAA